MHFRVPSVGTAYSGIHSIFVHFIIIFIVITNADGHTVQKDMVVYVTRWINLNSTMNNWINYNGWLVNWFENGWFFKSVQRVLFVSLICPIVGPLFRIRRNQYKWRRKKKKEEKKNHRQIIVSTPIAIRQNVIAVVSNHLNWWLCYSLSLHWLRYIDNFIFIYYNFILFDCFIYEIREARLEHLFIGHHLNIFEKRKKK